MDLNKLLASFCRQRILIELSKKKEKELSIMALVRKVNSYFDEVNRNVLILETEGFVTECVIGRMRFIKLNEQNERLLVLLEALKSLESDSFRPPLDKK
jgi:hypothetical protein